MTAPILHVNGRSKRFTERCGCEVVQEHGEGGYVMYDPCNTHRDEGMLGMAIYHFDRHPSIRLIDCGCELQYRGRKGGTSMIPCPKHRSAFFAGLHALGLMKEADK